jgi:hypothetical protein
MRGGNDREAQRARERISRRQTPRECGRRRMCTCLSHDGNPFDQVRPAWDMLIIITLARSVRRYEIAQAHPQLDYEAFNGKPQHLRINVLRYYRTSWGNTEHHGSICSQYRCWLCLPPTTFAWNVIRCRPPGPCHLMCESCTARDRI